jgi:hypothetical protein
MESRDRGLAVAHCRLQTVTAARLLSPCYAAAFISQRCGMTVCHPAVRAAMVLSIVRAPHMQLRCLKSPDPACPPHRLSHLAARQVDVHERRVRIRSHPPETRLHRLTDRLAWRIEWRIWWIARPSVPTASFPRVERCAVVWRVEKGSFEIDPQTSRGQYAWQILYLGGRHHVRLLV